MGLPAETWSTIERLRAAGLKWNVIGAQTNRNPNTLRREASERARAQTVIEPRPSAWYEQPVDIPTFHDDMAEIQAYIQSLTALKRPIVVHRTSDEHIGDEDPRAIAMNIGVAKAVQPDIWLTGDDTYDFPTVSSFAQAHGIRLEDALGVVRKPYLQYVEAYHAAAPDSAKFAMSGNHNDRVKRKTDEWWQFSDTITEGYATLVRANGRVLWAGWKQELDIFEMNFRHGERTNQNAAKTTIDNDLAYSSSTHFGHTHRLGLHVRTQRKHGRQRVLSSLNVGFAGRNPPTYKRHTNGVDWVWGSALIHVYTDDWIVNQVPVVYHETRGGGMVAFVGTQRIEVDSEGREVV